MRRKIEIGDKFNGVEVLAKINSKFLCRCHCGRECEIMAVNLKSKNFRGCGCGRTKRGKNNSNFKGVGEIRSVFLSRLRFQAKRRNKEFDITIDDLSDIFEKQNHKCAISDIPLILPEIHMDIYSKKCNMSIDRIDSSKGYTKDNIQWVDKDVNMAKQSLSMKEFIELCRKVAHKWPD